MRKLILLLCCFLLIIPSEAWGDKAENGLQASFIRNGYLWIKTGEAEEQITAEPGEFTNTPKWSYDGQWLLYEKEAQEPHLPVMENRIEIWVYNVKSKKHKRIFQGGANAKWAPSDYRVAFISNGVLNISDLDQFYNIALGVDDYNWYPDGKSFIVSSSAVLKPDGWTSPILYKVQLPEELENMNLTQQTRITYPQKSIGDYNPLYLKTAGKLTWVRKKLAEQKGDLWIAELSGKNAKLWAKDVEQYSFYENSGQKSGS